MLPGSEPPTSAWCARVAAKPSSVRETSVMSGRCVPPAYGSLRMKTSSGPGSQRDHGRHGRRASRRGGRGCARPGRPSARASSKSAVEQSRRSLMFAENAERISTAPISSATARSAQPITCSCDVHVRVTTSEPSRQSRPTQPAGIQAVAPSSSTTPVAGPRRAGASVAGAAPAPRRHVGRPHARRARAAGRGRRSRSAPRARGGTLGDVAAERDGQLERLARRSGRRPRPRPAAPRSVERHDERAHLVAPLVADGEPERGEHAGGRGDEHRRDLRAPPRARTRAAAPAPPKATSAKSRGSSPRSTETTRSAAQHLRVHDLDHVGRVGVDPRERALRRGAVELEPAGEPSRQPAEQQVRVGHRRRARRRGRSRPGPGSAPALSGPTRSAPPASRQTIEPPPAPTVWTSSVGSRIGRPPTSRSLERDASPPTIAQTSVEVPPMSNAIAFSIPARRASRLAPTTPAAGPESERPRRVRRRLLERRDAAGRAHHERLRQAGLGAARRERPQVAAEQRPEVRVRRRRRRALVLAELGRRPRARRRRAHPDGGGAARRRRRARARSRGTRRAGRRRSPRRRRGRAASSRSSGSSSPSGPIRPRTPMRALERDERLRMLRRRAGRGGRDPGGAGGGRARTRPSRRARSARRAARAARSSRSSSRA